MSKEGTAKTAEEIAKEKFPELFEQCNGGHHSMFGNCDVNFYERIAFIEGAKWLASQSPAAGVRWVAVETGNDKTYPPTQKHVLAYHSTYDNTSINYVDVYLNWANSVNGIYDDVTHWAYLPAKPGESPSGQEQGQAAEVARLKKEHEEGLLLYQNMCNQVSKDQQEIERLKGLLYNKIHCPQPDCKPCNELWDKFKSDNNL